MEEIIDKIILWHYRRNLIDGSSDIDQLVKLKEEVGELEESIHLGYNPIDDIGDIIVVLINIAERNKLTLQECLEYSYNDIKDRKGKMVDGIFVKEVI